jgi:hypothetical protein
MAELMLPSESSIEDAQRVAWRLWRPDSKPAPKRKRLTHGREVIAPARTGATLAEVAAELNVSPERVRQIEAAALKKLRRWCGERGLRLDDLLLQ